MANKKTKKTKLLKKSSSISKSKSKDSGIKTARE